MASEEEGKYLLLHAVRSELQSFSNNLLASVKVKISLLQAVEIPRVARG
jgi:hypothetical protein